MYLNEHHHADGTILGCSIVNWWFCLLSVKTKTNGTKTILVVADMLPKLQFHQLKLQLLGCQ